VGGLTQNSIVYVGAAGLLTSDSDLTYDYTTKTTRAGRLLYVDDSLFAGLIASSFACYTGIGIYAGGALQDQKPCIVFSGNTMELGYDEGPHVTDDGGYILLRANGGGATSGTGGYVQLSAGDATGGDSNGGDVILIAGAEHGAGTPGALKFKSPPSVVYGVLNFSGLATTDKTFTFPDASGSFALGAGTLTSATTNDVTVVNHTHAVSGSFAPSAHDMITSHTYTGGAALDVFGLSAANTIARLTPSSNPGAAAAILATNASGGLTFAADIIGKDFVRTRPGTITRASGYVSQVALTGGRTMTITRDGNNRISTIADGARTWTFTRDGNNQIASWAVA
jgi:hypothetical protein